MTRLFRPTSAPSCGWALERDPRTGDYFVRFHYAGGLYVRSTETSDLAKANVEARRMHEEVVYGRTIGLERQVADRARRLADDLGMLYTDEPIEETGIFEGDLGYVEHCAHELAHAMLLRLRFAPGVSKKVADAIERRKQQTQVWHEAAAWSIEWHALRELGVPIEWGDVTAGAEVQGVPQRLLHEVVEKDWARERGAELAAYLRGES